MELEDVIITYRESSTFARTIVKLTNLLHEREEEEEKRRKSSKRNLFTDKNEKNVKIAKLNIQLQRHFR